MASLRTSCIRCVDIEKPMAKNGKTKTGKQRYICRNCKKTQVESYSYSAYRPDINQQIITLTKEGLGIRSTARVLGISTTTLLKRIIAIGRNIPNPSISLGKTYEVDELRTFIKSKNRLIWIVYALERESKSVASFNIGARTNKTLNVVLESLRLSKPKKIFTDRLKNYSYLLPNPIHQTTRFGTNRIERKNLSLRTQLKRLNRKTICFSRSLAVLCAILRIYFWN